MLVAGASKVRLLQLTEVGEALELVQTALEEAGRKTSRGRAHLDVYPGNVYRAGLESCGRNSHDAMQQ